MAGVTCLAAIVLLLDTSASVPERLYVAQRDGTASAFETPALQRTIETRGPVAAMVIEFGYVALVRLGWTILRDRDDAMRFAAAFRALDRSGRNGNTAIGHAIAQARGEFDSVPCRPEFRLIDISTDGAETTPRVPAAAARDAALQAGIVINAIAFPPDLGDAPAEAAAEHLQEAEDWLRAHVATGFVRVANDVEGFAAAFRSKVVQELAALPAAAE
jgi:hypothetical protein